MTHVASDLFIPSGNISTESYIKELLPIYENHDKRIYPLISLEDYAKAHDMLVHFNDLFKTKGAESREYKDYLEVVCNLEGNLNFAFMLLSRSEEERDKIVFQRHNHLVKVIEDIKAGQNLPLGYFIRKEAKSRKIPSVTVTSTDHHDIAFEPLRDQLAPYVDELVDGKKEWKKGFEKLLKPDYRKIYFRE